MDDFRRNLLTHFSNFRRTLATDNGDWVVKGFIDVYRNIYTISVDTKVVSKIMELMLFPIISQFAAEHNYRWRRSLRRLLDELSNGRYGTSH